MDEEQKEQEQKECPLGLIDSTVVHAYCIREKCAWWVMPYGECAVVAIGRQINYLQGGPQ